MFQEDFGIYFPMEPGTQQSTSTCISNIQMHLVFHSIKNNRQDERGDCSSTVENDVKEGKASMKRKTFALRICARNAYACAKAEARFKYKHGKDPPKRNESNDLLGRNTEQNNSSWNPNRGTWLSSLFLSNQRMQNHIHKVSVCLYHEHKHTCLSFSVCCDIISMLS